MTTFDYTTARELMVEQQIRPWDVSDNRVLQVLGELPREDFLPEAQRGLAYADIPLPLGHGEFTTKPVLIGRALQALGVAAHEEVLEIGTGSGYVTACLARLAREVVSLELHADLAGAARARLSAQGIANARIEQADAFTWDTERRFDAICVTGAVARLPAQALRWLKPGGRMFVIHGRPPAMDAALVRGDVNAPRVQSLFETDVPYLVGGAPVPAFEF